MSTVAIPPPQAGIETGLEVRLRAAGYNVLVTPAGTPDAPWSADDLRDFFSNVDAVVASPARLYPAEFFAAARRLRLITSPVIGVDTIDIARPMSSA